MSATVHIDGGYYFHPHRSDHFAAYYYPARGADRRARYLGDDFPTAASAEAAISASRSR